MPTSYFSGFAPVIADWLNLPLSFVAAGTMAMVIGWFCWRTGSTHVILTGLWRIVYGRAASADREIAKLIETRSRLVKFRFFTNMRVRTLAQAKRLAAWAEKNDEELWDVRGCGDLFDRETCQLREERIPGTGMMLTILAATTLLGMAILIGLLGVSTNKALLKMKEGGAWFALSTESASQPFGAGLIGKDDCKGADRGQIASFTEKEIETICNAFDDSKTKAFIHQTVSQQRFAFGYLSILLTILALSSNGAFRRGSFAIEMQKRLRERKSKDGHANNR